MEERNNIVERIRELANAHGYSLPTLEAKLGLGNGTISRWSKSAPNSDKLAKVADEFHVSIDYLLGRETFSDPDPDTNYTILSRNAKKLSPEKREKLLNVARLMFSEEFKD